MACAYWMTMEKIMYYKNKIQNLFDYDILTGESFGNSLTEAGMGGPYIRGLFFTCHHDAINPLDMDA